MKELGYAKISFSKTWFQEYSAQFPRLFAGNVAKQCDVYHPPVITIFIGGMFTIPSNGWFIIVLTTL